MIYSGDGELQIQKTEPLEIILSIFIVFLFIVQMKMISNLGFERRKLMWKVVNRFKLESDTNVYPVV